MTNDIKISMIKFIENGNFSPVLRITLCVVGASLVLMGHELHLFVNVLQMGLFIKVAGLLSYWAASRNVRPFDRSFKKTFATYEDKKPYEEDMPFWMPIMVICVRLYCWPDLHRQQLKSGIEQNRKKNTKCQTLRATAKTVNGLCVIADIKQIEGCFILGMSISFVDKRNGEIEETRHQFPSAKALSLFLETQTILRLGDFKSSPG